MGLTIGRFMNNSFYICKWKGNDILWHQSEKEKIGTYEIIVSLGYNVKGKKITKSTTYKPEPSMTEKAAIKEAKRQSILFEEKVKKGEYGDKTLKLVDYINEIWFKEYLKNKSPSTIYRYEILTRLIIEQLRTFRNSEKLDLCIYKNLRTFLLLLKVKFL